ncbi:MAG: hypothetical protein LBF19_06000 [Prevotellaceae bacterium]|jgi:acyl-ACP thioesterase|nr:hypothetical protein [Prevotellaceae bacterium]
MDDWHKKVLAETHQIPTYFVDFEQKMTIPSLFLLMQEAAWRQATRHGFGYRQLQEKGLFWVLAKIKVIIRHYPQWTDTIRLETWSKEPERLTAYRDFEGFDAHDRRLFAATSAWHILSAATNRPQSLDDFRTRFPIPEGRHAIEEKPAKLPSPVNPATTAAATVLPSDIDLHRHVNNTRYVQWVLDCFPFAFLQTHRIREIEVNFLQQAKVADTYRVDTEALSDVEYLSSILREHDGKDLARIRTLWEATNTL